MLNRYQQIPVGIIITPRILPYPQVVTVLKSVSFSASSTLVFDKGCRFIVRHKVKYTPDADSTNRSFLNFKEIILMENYDTVVAALKGLKDKGYTLDFNITFDSITCAPEGIYLHTNDFEITEVYRFEGATNPDDEDIVYAIQSKDGRIKGSMTSAYGMYADGISNDMIQKLAMHT